MSIENSFYFLRHGETQFNKDRLVQGHLDSQLNAIGRAQAARAAEILKSVPISRIVSSPLSRARYTAEAVASKHDVDVVFDEGLMECNLGDRQGEPYGDWLEDYWAGEYDPPNGETFRQFCERVWRSMQSATSLGPDTLIVAHRGLLRAAQEYVPIESLKIPIPNALPVHIEPNNGIWHLTILKE